MIDNNVQTNGASLLGAIQKNNPKPANSSAFEALMSAMASESRATEVPERQTVRPAARPETPRPEMPRAEMPRPKADSPAVARRSETARRDDVKTAEKPDRPAKLHRVDNTKNDKKVEKGGKPEDTAKAKVKDSAKSADSEKVDDSAAVSKELAAASDSPQVEAPAGEVSADVAAAVAGADVETVETTGVEDTAVSQDAPELALAVEPAADTPAEEAQDVPAQTAAPKSIDGAELMAEIKDGKAAESEAAVTAKTTPAAPTPSDQAPVTPTEPKLAPVAEMPATEDTAVQMSQMVAGQAAAPKVASAAAPASQSTPTVSGVNTTNVTPAQAAAPAQAPAVATANPVTPSAPVYAPNLSQQVFEQLQAQLSRLRSMGAGQHQLKIAVNPETFGPVRVAANFHADGTVQLQLLGSNDAAREQLRQVLSDLRRDLASTGLTAQLDLAENSQEFAQFTGAGQDSRNDGTSRDGLRGQDVSRSANDKENEVIDTTPKVGDVLKDGSDGTVDMFA